MAGGLLSVQGLKVLFNTESGIISAVDGVDISINSGETLCIVGESGCGKSITSLSIMRLIDEPPGKIAAGKILFEGQDLLTKSAADMRQIRGNKISMIFQEPMTSLNPVFTCGSQLTEAVRLHQEFSPAAAQEKAVEMLKMVGIPLPERRMNDYPHQLSGGMRQRIMIAMALVCHPRLLIADEPTTALDVTIQAQILELMKELKQELGMAIMLITHDLGVVAEMAERVIVMYAGRVVEESEVRQLFRNPLHPYTAGLLKSVPRIDKKHDQLYVINGAVPNPLAMPKGCRFNTRCVHAWDICREKEPALSEVSPGRLVRCWLKS
jgi:oligopeptide/dipeptide ABC transporter, ATP-binding protein, C-terminal domain